ncbi:MAG: hypothetical protein HY711_06240 [Candidatus Melainabacteria bacterium]|nr:hypothetical protein [Candidatus Melainabacteria bacterium]
MGSHAYTVATALATATICFLLTCLDWLQLLLAFVLAGLAWSFWSITAGYELNTGGKLVRGKQKSSNLAVAKRNTLSASNIYQFPNKLSAAGAASPRRKRPS